MQRDRQLSLSWELLLGQRCRRWLLAKVISRDASEEDGLGKQGHTQQVDIFLLFQDFRDEYLNVFFGCYITWASPVRGLCQRLATFPSPPSTF